MKIKICGSNYEQNGIINALTSTVTYLMFYIWAMNFKVLRQEEDIT